MPFIKYVIWLVDGKNIIWLLICLYKSANKFIYKCGYLSCIFLSLLLCYNEDFNLPYYIQCTARFKQLLHCD